jgi:glycosyltransferase involved in cell wall biosynthesis
LSAPKEFIVDLSEDPKIKSLAGFYPAAGSNGQNYYYHLKNMCKGGLESHVNFTGRVPYEKVIEYYAQADILINPSFSESFGMSLVEAMSAEKPVVATDAGSVSDVVRNGETGILVPPNNFRGVAEGILALLNNRELGRRLGSNGRKLIERRFSCDIMTEKILELYGRLYRAKVEQRV